MSVKNDLQQKLVEWASENGNQGAIEVQTEQYRLNISVAGKGEVTIIPQNFPEQCPLRLAPNEPIRYIIEHLPEIRADIFRILAEKMQREEIDTRIGEELEDLLKKQLELIE
jgi:hypothetical protein